MTQQKIMTKPSGIDVSIPYIISPRSTFLDTCQPKLKWNKVEGATSYTVKIVTDSNVIWEQEVTDTEIECSSDISLESGKTYTLIVTSDNDCSSESDSDSSESVFGILDEDSTRKVQNELEAIDKKELTEEEYTLELIDIFIVHGLNAKAIEILEQQAAADSRNPAIYAELGNLYRFAGLNLLAEKQYRKTLNLIREEQNIREQIIAKFGLAEILPLLCKEEEANRLKQEVKQDLKTIENSRNIAQHSVRARCCTTDDGELGIKSCNPIRCICVTTGFC